MEKLSRLLAILVAITTITGVLIKIRQVLLLRSLKKSVKYRDIIKLKHFSTGHGLHSHLVKYKHDQTSGQQQVTAYAEADSNDNWVIKGPHGESEYYREGKSVKHSDIIRLEHANTRKNLHSHKNHPSPLTHQQEVTAYGVNGLGDSNDNWRVEVEGYGWWYPGKWYKEKRVRLIHVDTGYALHSNLGYSSPEYTEGQQEVTCYKERDQNDWWCLGT